MSYQLALDVYYYDDYAVVGYVLFEDHVATEAFRTGQVRHVPILPYVSGAFYQRELPCLLRAIGAIPEELSLIYVDANVWVAEGAKGLGAYLYEALDRKIPVIGVSKSRFIHTEGYIFPVKRGTSERPLYVSAAGIDPEVACQYISEMHGAYRLPELIKQADMLCRQSFNN